MEGERRRRALEGLRARFALVEDTLRCEVKKVGLRWEDGDVRMTAWLGVSVAWQVQKEALEQLLMDLGMDPARVALLRHRVDQLVGGAR